MSNEDNLFFDQVSLYLQALHSLTTPLMAIDRDYRVLFINQAGARLLESTPESVVGKKCFDLFQTSCCHTAECCCRQSIQRGERGFGNSIAHIKNSVLKLGCDSTPFIDDNGKIAGAVVMIHEVSEVDRLAEEIETLASALSAGKLDARGKPEAYQNDTCRSMLQGINSMLEAVINPLCTAAQYLDSLSQGQTPPKITETYPGDLNHLKESMNRCIDEIGILVKEVGVTITASREGKLSVKANAEHSKGVFRKILRGLNDAFGAVLKPIEEAATVLGILANSDLRARVTGDYWGDHARIKDSINTMADALHLALLQVAEATEQVSAASAHIASSSQMIAHNAAHEVRTIEQTSSTLEKISTMTLHNAQNTQKAKELAQFTKGAAEGGQVAMERMNFSMKKIHSAADCTAEIIRDINEIAFQTNLLALNAAVEAARAGDAGKSFAVVAEEVRNLAIRAKEAAKKTEELIKQSVKLSSEGEEVSKEVSSTLTEIVTSVGKVTNLVSEIAEVSQEQKSGIEMVNKAILQMEQIVQQAASNSNKTSQEAALLSNQAQVLSMLVSKFQLENT